MVYITSICTIKQYKRKVCLSNGADFVLYKKELDRFGLKEEMDLSDELYQQIVEEIFIPRAKRRAMHLLEKMDRSEKQLRLKLKDDGYPPEAVETAIDYVKTYHYVDDERLARSYIRFYQTSRSRMRLMQDLMKKGIDKEVIQRCMEEENETSQIEMIHRLMEKKHYDSSNATREEKAKMYRFLMQRGFPSSEITRAMGELWEN